MEHILEILHTHIQWAPFIIFGLLILAGFNVPVSEDLMLFTSAILSFEHPELFSQLLIAVFLGAYLSDLIAYWLGRKLGPHLWDFKFFAKMVSKKKINTIHNFYEKYGILTLIFGRFIPFGVRNALFITAGLGKMNFFKFAISDLIACILSTSIFYPLYYYNGPKVLEYVKKGNIAVFITVLIAITIFFIVKRYKKNHK